MLKYIFLIVFCFNGFLNAQISVFDMTGKASSNIIKNSTHTKEKNETRISESEISKVAPTDEPDISIDNSQIYQNIEPNKLILTLSKAPTSVYTYQVFSMDLKADTEQNLNFDLNLTMNANNIIWLNPKPDWSENKRGIYETKLWFEANSTDANITDLTLTLNRNESFFQKSSIKAKLPLIKKLKADKNFANLVANDLIVKKVKSSKFDELNNIINIELESKNANLGLFSIPNSQNFQKQGIEAIKGDFDKQSGSYFIVANDNVKTIEFSYYNLKNSAFKSFKIPVKVEEEELSTQVNLNPKDSEFEFYKDIAVYTLIAIFLLIFIFSRSYYSLVLAVFLGIYAIYDSRPFSDAILKANSEVKILPTPNSTIFFIAKNPQKIKIMAKEGGFTKILLENSKIGWVANEYIK